MRDADRQLFLDCLLNARDCLYLSYVGQSVLSNEALPPSLLLSELKQFLLQVSDRSAEALARRRELVDKVIVRHPLQDWSLENFSEPMPQSGQAPVPVHFNAQFAVSRQTAAARRAFLESREGDLPRNEVPDAVAATELLRFLADPSRDYLKRRFHVDLEGLQWVQSAEDHESFELDGLRTSALRKRAVHEWLSAQQQGRLNDSFREAMKRNVQLELALPLGHAGAQVWNEQVVPVLDVLDAVLGERKLVKGAWSHKSCGVRFETDYWRSDDGQRVIFISGGLKDPKSKLQAFVEHIGSGQGSRIVCLRDKKCVHWPPFPGLAEDPGTDIGAAWLDDVLPLWAAGLNAPLPFSLEIAHCFVERLLKEPEQDRDAVLSAAYAQKWQSSWTFAQDCSAAQCLCFDGDSPASPSAAPELRATFATNAERILGPVLEWSNRVSPATKGLRWRIWIQITATGISTSPPLNWRLAPP